MLWSSGAITSRNKNCHSGRKENVRFKKWLYKESKLSLGKFTFLFGV